MPPSFDPREPAFVVPPEPYNPLAKTVKQLEARIEWLERLVYSYVIASVYDVQLYSAWPYNPDKKEQTK